MASSIVVGSPAGSIDTPGLRRFRRWVRFNLIGVAGAGVQLGVLAALSSAGFGYASATVLAVEAAVLHNFAWHRRWTWPNPGPETTRDHLRRLVVFNSTVGLISIAQNLGLMKVLVGHVEVHYLLANAITIGLCSIANFLVSDLWIFRIGGRKPAPAMRRIPS